MACTRFGGWSVLVVVAALLAACGGGGKGDGGGGGGRTIRVSGRIPAAGQALTAMAVAPASVQKLIVATSSNGSFTAPVVDGAFSFDAEAGAPVGVVLVGPGDSYLGYLAVRGSVAGLPLQAVDEDTVSLDLGTLIASGTVYAPGLDPIGRGITLSDAELATIAQLDQGFRMMVAYPDVDGDGAIDLLQGRVYFPQFGWSMHGGTLPALEGVPPATPGFREWTFGVGVQEEGVTSYPPYVTITGPDGSGVSGSSRVGMMSEDQRSVLYGIGAGWVAGSAPAPGGWTVGYADRTLAYEMPDFSGLLPVLPFPVPVIALNPDFTIRDIGVSWRLADGTPVERTPPIATSVQIQVDGDGSPSVPTCVASGIRSGQGNRVYNANVRLPGAFPHGLLCQDIPWAGVDRIYLGYTDVFGNYLLTTWQRP